MSPLLLTKQLTAEKIPINETMFPGYFMLKGDYLLVTGEKGDTMLYQYQTPQLHYKCGWGTKGQSEDEFQLFPMFAKNQSADVYIWGYDPTTIKRFSLEEHGELKFKDKYTLDSYESFNQMHISKDSILIYSAIPSEFAIKKVSLKNRQAVR